MSTQLQRNLTALAGILGTVALVAYYAAPVTFMPLPPANAPAAQVIAFGTAYQNVILFDAWLQAIGALLSVVFVLALVQMAGTASRLAGRLTLLAGGVVLALALAEGTFEIGAVMAAANGHIQTSLVCFLGCWRPGFAGWIGANGWIGRTMMHKAHPEARIHLHETRLRDGLRQVPGDGNFLQLRDDSVEERFEAAAGGGRDRDDLP